MFHTLVVSFFAVILFFLFLLSVIIGRKFGRWQIEHDSERKLGIVNVAEGAVFALLGLLIAFTFSGAYDRFEMRKMHIIEEANAYETAYLRVDLLVPETRIELRRTLYEYLDSRIRLYKSIPDFPKVNQILKISEQLQSKIWDLVIAACQTTHNDSATQLIIPAINTMFDTANTGFNITLVHSPMIIFVLLIGLAIIGSILTGFSTAENKTHKSIHIISYVLIISFTIFLIINLELPRVGIVRVDHFDQILIDMKNNWHTHETQTKSLGNF